MSINLKYMGTKRVLAPAIGEIIRQARDGILLDAFCGMSTVGQEVGDVREIWSNDAELFAARVAAALFCSRTLPAPLIETTVLHRHAFQENRIALLERFGDLVVEEANIYETDSLSDLVELRKKCLALPHSKRSMKELSLLSKQPRTFPYRLFTFNYAGSYLGLAQCIEIDSLRYALDASLSRQDIDHDQFEWLIISLCKALIGAATTTGHFAQYLEPKASTLKRYLRQRRMGIWEKWASTIPEMTPIGHQAWRIKNKVFNQDATSTLETVSNFKDRPSVIYFDPPYTNDQYSRYYHLFDTLLRYDYPTIHFKGRYRTGRFCTQFWHRRHVVAAFDRLIGTARKLGAEVILSYPTNGLLSTVGRTPSELLLRHYPDVEECFRLHHEHSTFGASKGNSHQPATEIVYWAKP